MKKLSLNEGLFKNIEKTIIDPEDPDYIRKDRERAFNNFKQSDINKQKSVIEEWIFENITVCDNYKINGFGNRWAKLSEQVRDIYYYIDDNMEIHLLSPNPPIAADLYTVYRIRRSASIFSDDASDNPNNQSFKEFKELRYKIAECQASLIIDGTNTSLYCELESLKNLPEKIGMENYHTLFWVTKTKIKSLEGCPKIINCTYFDVSGNQLESLKGCPDKILNFSETDITGFNAANNNITSLNDGPVSVDGFFNVSSNKLTNLKGGPTLVTKNYHASHNPITSLTGAPAEIKSDFYCNYVGTEETPLINLIGSPRIVEGQFQVSHSRLKSMVGCPKRINGTFDISYNSLTSLENGPEYIGISYKASGNPLTTIKGIMDTDSSNSWATLDITDCRRIPYSEIRIYGNGYNKWRIKCDSDAEFMRESVTLNTFSHLSLNEGSFKDIEQTIINQDDPDYVEKDRERMFNQFKSKDFDSQQINEIERWIWSHVYVHFRSSTAGMYSSNKMLLEETDEGVLYKIKKLDGKFYIDLIGGDGCYYTIKMSSGETELPYPFDKCDGTTVKISSHLASLKNIPRESEYMDLSGNDIKSFKDMPAVCVHKTFELSTNNIIDFTGFPEDCSIETLRITYAGIASFNGFPKSIKLNWLDLNYNNINSFKGLPDNLKICNTLDLSNNCLKDFSGFPDNLYIGNTLNLSSNCLTTAHVPLSLTMHDTNESGYVGAGPERSMIIFDNNPEIKRYQIPGPTEKIRNVLYKGLGKNLNNY